jgi:hypothetical protein
MSLHARLDQIDSVAGMGIHLDDGLEESFIQNLCGGPICIELATNFSTRSIWIIEFSGYQDCAFDRELCVCLDDIETISLSRVDRLTHAR